MDQPVVKRSIFQRLLGIPATPLPEDVTCWTYAGGRVTVYLDRVPELARPGGALRLEGDELPARVLVVRDEEGTFHALHNRCTHAGRRLDPVPGHALVQCCSIRRSTYGHGGGSVAGPGRRSVRAYPVEVARGRLFIDLGLSPEGLAAGGQP